MKHKELYSTLIKNRMAFLPIGRIELKTIYDFVENKYPNLCDDDVLCKDICSHGANQPEWKHRVRTALHHFKNKGLIEKSNQRGFWIVKSPENSTPNAFDLSAGSINPDRLKTTTYRILRDTNLSIQIKELHKNRCQICGNTITLKSGRNYSEAHHIKPLGSNHKGPDVPENIIILCPNHHVMCDYGVIKLDSSNIRMVKHHNISDEYIEYHNTSIYGNGV